VDTTGNLAVRCQAAERGIRILCDYLTSIGLLTKEGDRYALGPDAAAFLDKRSPAYFGEGLFMCEETPQGTRVVHRETFVFHPPLGRLVERFLRAWIARDVREEVFRMERAMRWRSSVSRPSIA
jgi:hypothetical protein